MFKYTVHAQLKAKPTGATKLFTGLFKAQKLKSSNAHSTQNFVVSFVYVLMDALPGIVDGARKISQGGRWILVGARGRNRRFSLLPMLETTTSRDQCIGALP